MIYVAKVSGSCYEDKGEKRCCVQVEFIDNPKQEDNYSDYNISKYVKSELDKQKNSLGINAILMNNDIGISINFAISAKLDKIGKALATIFNGCKGLYKDKDEKAKFEALSEKYITLAPFVNEFIGNRD